MKFLLFIVFIFLVKNQIPDISTLSQCLILGQSVVSCGPPPQVIINNGDLCSFSPIGPFFIINNGVQQVSNPFTTLAQSQLVSLTNYISSLPCDYTISGTQPLAFTIFSVNF